MSNETTQYVLCSLIRHSLVDSLSDAEVSNSSTYIKMIWSPPKKVLQKFIYWNSF